jgi:4-azaleucine resistance transporter AzlC
VASALPSAATPRSEFLAGIRGLLPSMPGVIVFSSVIGVAAATTGISVLQAATMALVVFAGTSQLVALQMVAAQVPLGVIWLTVAVINMRFLMYSLSMAPHFKALPLRWKALMAYVMTDQVYAFSAMRFGAAPAAPHKHWYTLGAGITLGVPWVAATVAGYRLGSGIPASWSLDFCVPLTFIGLLGTALVDRHTLAAALVAGVAAVAAVALPMRLGLIVAALCGVTAGAVMQRCSKT